MQIEHMARHARDEADAARAEVYFDKARELEARSKTFHDMVLKHESLSGDNLEAAGERG
jgi:hypothetical protein